MATTELPLPLKIRKAVRTRDSVTLLSLLVSPPDTSDTTIIIAPQWIAYEACRQGATDFLISLLKLRAQCSIEMMSPQRWDLDDWIDTSCGDHDEDDDEDSPVNACTTTLLVEAAALSDPTCVELLLAYGTNPYQLTEAGDLPLWQASRYGRLRTVQRLVAVMRTTESVSSPKAPPNSTTVKDWATRAIQLACQFGHLDLVQYLLTDSGVVSGSSVFSHGTTTEDERGWNLWFDAALAGQRHIIKWLWTQEQQQQYQQTQMNNGGMHTDDDPPNYSFFVAAR